HQPGDGGGLVIGQLPVAAAVHVADGDSAGNDGRAVALHLETLDMLVVLIDDVGDDFLQDILQRDDAAHLSVFVNDDGKVFLAPTESLQLREQVGGFRNKPGRAGDGEKIQLLDIRILRL